ncbi:Phytochrome-like protein cph1 [Tepidimonas alkaliphilus]|uniref:histidine kinase n=1 Tax=Tepidimonas alkaliphilus TaxID=2588942 RepID=A0A554WBH0_9BURK|nr:ATP-binding protein [Tepidimonas alkaliphilus]TSE20928.1 Phytochrome-like protein cph1 [Tepidimonas alkaliphilus]
MQSLPRDPWPSQLPPAFFAALPPQPQPEVLDEPERAAWRLLLGLPEAVLILDAQLRVQAANPAAQALLRPPLTPQAARTRLWHDALQDGWLQALWPWAASALRGERAEWVLPDPGGDATRQWNVRLEPDRLHGRVVGLLLLARAQAAAAPRDAQLANPLTPPSLRAPQHAPPLPLARWIAWADGLREAAIFFLDAHGAICEWPASAERLLGYPAQAVLGTPGPDGDDAPHPLPADTPQALERAALLGQSESMGWLRRYDGSRLWAQVVFTALSDTDGQPLGTACLVRDMTEVRRLEELLRELNQALERKVQQRTQALQAAVEDLEAFASSVSHDLRAPLRHITSYVQLLREDLGAPPTPEVAEDLRTIENAAAHMGRLIEGLLAFARTGHAALQWQPVDMLSLLRASLNRVLHDPALQRPEDEIELRLPAALPAVHGDPLLLARVWDNLLANALKYSRPRHPAVIEVGGELQRRPDGTPLAVFWVRDNGVGFDPAQAERLFGMFQRLHRAQDFDGTGIGLALARRIVERHGGWIQAEGRPDAGATFTFALPSLDDTAPAGGDEP